MINQHRTKQKPLSIWLSLSSQSHYGHIFSVHVNVVADSSWQSSDPTAKFFQGNRTKRMFPSNFNSM